MSVSDPNPEPADTPGLTPGGSVVQGDTPPAAASEPAATSDESGTPNQGPTEGNRTPMVVGLVVLAVVVAAMVVWAVTAALS